MLKTEQDLLPYDGEATAHFVAAKCPNFSLPIKASNLKTISLLDNKPVCDASKLLKRGKFSSSKIVNYVLTSISDLNLDFHHISGKMGQNFVDDFGSRNPAQCSEENKSKCKVCNFIKDCSQLTMGNLSFLVSESSDSIIGQVDIGVNTSNLINDVIRGVKSVPFSNRRAMKFMQDKDPALVRVRELLLAGQRAGNKDKLPVKRYLHKLHDITIARDGCLVARKRNKKNLIERELVVIPENVSLGLLYSMHLNLNHPTVYQLTKTVDTRFFILDKDKNVRSVWTDCALCQSVKDIPEEIHEFEPNQVPDHPGKSFTVDVLKCCKKNILVAVENFSGFTSTCFIKSEKNQDLLEGIINTVHPFKSSSLSTIRVDQAPGFRKAMKQQANLKELGIDLIPGEAKNKNAPAIVVKKIKE